LCGEPVILEGESRWLCKRPAPLRGEGNSGRAADSFELAIREGYNNQFHTSTMASSVEQSPFFHNRRAKGNVVVTGTLPIGTRRLGALLTHLDPPKFDLESYISNYGGKKLPEVIMTVEQVLTV
jgi:hypothetical protein